MLMEDPTNNDTPTYKTCTGCEYVITSKYLSLNGEDWHSSCVLCDECMGPVFTGEATDKFHIQDGKKYCQDCVCADCGQPAKKYVKALGKIWHTFHFKCSSCKSILDTYAEVDGEAYCQPCHQRMSAKSFTRAKRRSFGTEKREQAAAKAAARPPWAQKKAVSTAPKSALDVMHKSWFQNGLNKKPPSPSPSPSPSPTPQGNGYGSANNSPRGGASSPTFNRPYSPTPATPPSPSTPKYSPTTTHAKPAGRMGPPLSSASSLQHQQQPSPQQRPSWIKAQEEKPKNTWQAPAPKPTNGPTPAPWNSSMLKPVAGKQPASAASRTTSPSPASNGYTSINFVPHSPAQPKARGPQVAHDPAVPPGAINIGDILDTIFRPLTEEEIGSLAFQALPLLADYHNRGQLHNNIKHKTIYISQAGVVSLIENDGEDENKVGGTSIKFKAPESALSVASDMYPS